MITRTIICDRCGHSETIQEGAGKKTDRTFATILLTCTIPEEYIREREMAKALWCKPCVQATGLVFPVPKNTPTPPPPTLEELIAEIASEAALQVIQNN